MDLSSFTLILFFMIGAGLTFFLLSSSFCKKIFEEKVLFSIFSISTSVLFGAILIAVFFWNHYDFVSDITPLRFVLPLLCLPFIFGSFFIRKPYAVSSALLISCAISIFGSGLTISFFPNAPLLINSILTVFVFWIFSLGFRATASIGTLPQIDTLTICTGLVFTYLLGQAPQSLALGAACLLSATLVSYFLNTKNPLGTNATPILGYILGWLGLISYQEFLGSCFLIFAMFYIIEAFIAFFRKATFLPQYQDIAYNSLLLQAIQAKIPVSTLIRLIVISNLLLVVLGLFQLVSSNQTSLPIFAALLISWQLYRALNWQQENKTLKEVNKEIITQVKDSFNNIISSKKKKDHADKDK